MALYTPSYKTVESEVSVYFDGKESSSDEAKVMELSGDFNARVFLERSNDGGESWETVSQFDTGSLVGSWHTDNIQTMIQVDTRRVRIDNMDKKNGLVEAIGEEL